MVSLSFRRKVAVLLLVMAFAAPLASTAEPRLDTRRAGDLLARAWSVLIALWSEEGCTIDPSGKCTHTSPTTDNGCTIDPDGKCAAGASESPFPGESPDNGCTLDPNGKCQSGS